MSRKGSIIFYTQRQCNEGEGKNSWIIHLTFHCCIRSISILFIYFGLSLLLPEIHLSIIFLYINTHTHTHLLFSNIISGTKAISAEWARKIAERDWGRAIEIAWGAGTKRNCQDITIKECWRNGNAALQGRSRSCRQICSSK